MSKQNNNDVITYIPERDPEEMGKLRRGIWFYTHQLGMNFTLVLALSLFYQSFVAVFIAVNGIKTLPIFAGLGQDTAGQVLGNVGAVVIGLVIQGLIVAELAQVVWLRRPDRLKVRLMSDSIWWWVILVALVASIAVDFFLLFLSVTGTADLSRAWAVASKNQMAFATNILLAILNLLTLLRCASVMRTSTSEEIRQEVEERLKAIAEEILIDAGDSARAKAAQVWKKLSVNPQRFLPIHDSVFELISKQHPELLPPALGGDNWAYDFTGNTFAVLPPDLHQALLQARHQATKSKRNISTDLDEADADLWRRDPADLAKLINYNLETLGRPRFVDASEPDEPRFMSRSAQFAAIAPALPAGTQMVEALPQTARPQSAVVAAPGQSVVNLPPREKALFAAYLMNVVFPHVHGTAFPQGQGVSVFEAFDEIEMQWYYRYWSKRVKSS